MRISDWSSDVCSSDLDARRYTYRELHAEVCRFANVLKGQGVKKGDRVTLYLPMIPEAAFAMLACARLGAVHSVVFRSEEHTSELQSLMRTSYAVFCLKKNMISTELSET